MEEYIMYVYKTTNLITNHIYIGQHIYKKDTKNKKYLGSGKLLLKKVKEYGRENFKVEILEYCETMKNLNIQEIYWINQFNSTKPEIGYNITAGGSQCLPTERYKEIMKSPERLEKFRNTRIKNKDKHLYNTQEYKNKVSQRVKGENNPNYGKRWCKEKRDQRINYLKNNRIYEGENNPMWGKRGENNPSYKHIPNDIKEKILYDYLNNFICVSKLSEKYNFPEKKISILLKKNNLEIKQIYISKENEEKIINMFLNDKIPIKKIAKYFNIEHRNIRNVLLKNYVTIVNYQNIKKEKIIKEKIEKITTSKEKIKKSKNFGIFIRKGEDNPNYKPIPNDIKEKILYEYINEFTSTKKLSEKYNINLEKLRKYLNDKGIDTKCLYISPAIKEKMIKLYTINNMTITQISKYYNLDVRNIRKVLNENNIKILTSNSKRKKPS